MARPTLLLLDEARHRWGRPIHVSKNPHAVGRTYGKGYHNYELHGKVYAVDVIPEGLETQADARRFRKILEEIVEEYNIPDWGLGIYPKWESGVGIHIDTGDRGKDSGFASWSALPLGPNGEQKYYGWETGVYELE